MKTIYLLSACLAGERCRYDAKIARNDELMGFLDEQGYEYITSCPEVAGGLPTQRAAARILTGDGFDVLKGDSAVIDATGRDVTGEFVTGARKVAGLALRAGVTGAILNERSPSCGVRYIYKGEELVNGVGITTALLMKNGIKVVSDEEFLKNACITSR